MLFLLKVIIFCAISVGTVVKLFFHLNETARALQQVYVRAAKKQGQDSYRWKTSRMRIVAKIGVIFIGLTIIFMSFALLFGPIKVGS